MKPFLLKLLGFVLIQAVLLMSLMIFYDGGDLPFFERFNNQYEMAGSSPSPRLFIFGGSSTPLAFDSRMIQEATGYHVVNMGLNGGLSLSFILNQARDVVRRGDVVILALEHAFFDSPSSRHYQFVMLTNALLVRPSTVEYMMWSEVKGIFDAGLLYLRYVLRSSLKNLFNQQVNKISVVSINPHGDRVVSPEVTARVTLPPFREFHRLDNSDENIDGIIDGINDFAAECENRGVQVYFFYGPYPEEYFQHNRLFLERMHRRMLAHSRIPILSEPIDTAVPSEMFLDTEYHVNPKLRRQGHTALFIERFKKGAKFEH